MQTLLQKRPALKLHPIATLYYVAPCCLVFLTLPWVIFEARSVIHGLIAGTVHLDAWVMITNASLAFAFNLATLVLLSRTSGKHNFTLSRLYHSATIRR